MAGGGCFVFGPGRVGPRLDPATKVVAGVARRLEGRPLDRASKGARGPGGLRSAAKRKQAGFVDRQKMKALARLAVADSLAAW